MATLSLLAVLFGAAGCGGASSGAGETEADAFYPQVKGPGREFLVRGGDNLVQATGEEATPAERERVSRLIQLWMRVRVAENWGRDCGYLSRRYVRIIVKDANGVTHGRVKNCPDALDYFGESASGDLANTLTGPIDSLRVEGNQGYVQWHGIKGIDWVLPVRREGGEWLVDIAAPLYRNR
jgi:hypothetical protein